MSFVQNKIAIANVNHYCQSLKGILKLVKLGKIHNFLKL